MKAPLEPLPPEIQKLLVEERRIPRQPAGSRQRMLGRAHASLRDPMVLGGISGVLASLWGTAAAKVATAGAVVTLGILGTTALMVRGSRPQAGTSETNDETAAASVQPSPASSSMANSDRPAFPSAIVPVLPAHDTVSSSVAAELALLERARAFLANGRLDVALQVLSVHRHDFARGRLVEEREGLRIRALVGQGRRGDARRALNQFRGRFPHSVLLPDMEALVGNSHNSGAGQKR